MSNRIHNILDTINNYHTIVAVYGRTDENEIFNSSSYINRQYLHEPYHISLPNYIPNTSYNFSIYSSNYSPYINSSNEFFISGPDARKFIDMLPSINPIRIENILENIEDYDMIYLTTDINNIYDFVTLNYHHTSYNILSNTIQNMFYNEYINYRRINNYTIYNTSHSNPNKRFIFCGSKANEFLNKLLEHMSRRTNINSNNSLILRPNPLFYRRNEDIIRFNNENNDNTDENYISRTYNYSSNFIFTSPTYSSNMYINNTSLFQNNLLNNYLPNNNETRNLSEEIIKYSNENITIDNETYSANKIISCYHNHKKNLHSLTVTLTEKFKLKTTMQKENESLYRNIGNIITMLNLNSNIFSNNEEITNYIQYVKDFKEKHIKIHEDIINVLDSNIEYLLKRKKYIEINLKEFNNFMKMVNETNDLRTHLCSICYENEVNMCLIPCGHTLCENCSLKLSYNCHSCRRNIEDRIKLYF